MNAMIYVRRGTLIGWKVTRISTVVSFGHLALPRIRCPRPSQASLRFLSDDILTTPLNAPEQPINAVQKREIVVQRDSLLDQLHAASLPSEQLRILKEFTDVANGPAAMQASLEREFRAKIKAIVDGLDVTELHEICSLIGDIRFKYYRGLKEPHYILNRVTKRIESDYQKDPTNVNVLLPAFLQCCGCMEKHMEVLPIFTQHLVRTLLRDFAKQNTDLSFEEYVSITSKLAQLKMTWVNVEQPVEDMLLRGLVRHVDQPNLTLKQVRLVLQGLAQLGLNIRWLPDAELIEFENWCRRGLRDAVYQNLQFPTVELGTGILATPPQTRQEIAKDVALLLATMAEVNCSVISLTYHTIRLMKNAIDCTLPHSTGQYTASVVHSMGKMDGEWRAVLKYSSRRNILDNCARKMPEIPSASFKELLVGLMTLEVQVLPYESVTRKLLSATRFQPSSSAGATIADYVSHLRNERGYSPFHAALFGDMYGRIHQPFMTRHSSSAPLPAAFTFDTVKSAEQSLRLAYLSLISLARLMPRGWRNIPVEVQEMFASFFTIFFTEYNETSRVHLLRSMSILTVKHQDLFTLGMEVLSRPPVPSGQSPSLPEQLTHLSPTETVAKSVVLEPTIEPTTAPTAEPSMTVATADVPVIGATKVNSIIPLRALIALSKNAQSLQIKWSKLPPVMQDNILDSMIATTAFDGPHAHLAGHLIRLPQLKFYYPSAPHAQKVKVHAWALKIMNIMATASHRQSNQGTHDNNSNGVDGSFPTDGWFLNSLIKMGIKFPRVGDGSWPLLDGSSRMKSAQALGTILERTLESTHSPGSETANYWSKVQAINAASGLGFSLHEFFDQQRLLEHAQQYLFFKPFDKPTAQSSNDVKRSSMSYRNNGIQTPASIVAVMNSLQRLSVQLRKPSPGTETAVPTSVGLSPDQLSSFYQVVIAVLSRHDITKSLQYSDNPYSFPFSDEVHRKFCSLSKSLVLMLDSVDRLNCTLTSSTFIPTPSLSLRDSQTSFTAETGNRLFPHLIGMLNVLTDLRNECLAGQTLSNISIEQINNIKLQVLVPLLLAPYLGKGGNGHKPRELLDSGHLMQTLQVLQHRLAGYDFTYDTTCMSVRDGCCILQALGSHNVVWPHLPPWLRHHFVANIIRLDYVALETKSRDVFVQEVPTILQTLAACQTSWIRMNSQLRNWLEMHIFQDPVTWSAVVSSQHVQDLSETANHRISNMHVLNSLGKMELDIADTSRNESYMPVFTSVTKSAVLASLRDFHHQQDQMRLHDPSGPETAYPKLISMVSGLRLVGFAWSSFSPALAEQLQRAIVQHQRQMMDTPSALSTQDAVELAYSLSCMGFDLFRDPTNDMSAEYMLERAKLRTAWWNSISATVHHLATEHPNDSVRQQLTMKAWKLLPKYLHQYIREVASLLSLPSVVTKHEEDLRLLATEKTEGKSVSTTGSWEPLNVSSDLQLIVQRMGPSKVRNPEVKESLKESPKESLKKLAKESPKEFPKKSPKEFPLELPNESLKELPNESLIELPSESPKELPTDSPEELPRLLPKNAPREETSKALPIEVHDDPEERDPSSPVPQSQGNEGRQHRSRQQQKKWKADPNERLSSVKVLTQSGTHMEDDHDGDSAEEGLCEEDREEDWEEEAEEEAEEDGEEALKEEEVRTVYNVPAVITDAAEPEGNIQDAFSDFDEGPDFVLDADELSKDIYDPFFLNGDTAEFLDLTTEVDNEGPPFGKYGDRKDSELIEAVFDLDIDDVYSTYNSVLAYPNGEPRELRRRQNARHERRLSFRSALRTLGILPARTAATTLDPETDASTTAIAGDNTEGEVKAEGVVKAEGAVEVEGAVKSEGAAESEVAPVTSSPLADVIPISKKKKRDNKKTIKSPKKDVAVTSKTTTTTASFSSSSTASASASSTLAQPSPLPAPAPAIATATAPATATATAPAPPVAATTASTSTTAETSSASKASTSNPSDTSAKATPKVAASNAPFPPWKRYDSVDLMRALTTQLSTELATLQGLEQGQVKPRNMSRIAVKLDSSPPIVYGQEPSDPVISSLRNVDMMVLGRFDSGDDVADIFRKNQVWEPLAFIDFGRGWKYQNPTLVDRHRKISWPIYNNAERSHLQQQEQQQNKHKDEAMHSSDGENGGSGHASIEEGGMHENGDTDTMQSSQKKPSAIFVADQAVHQFQANNRRYQLKAFLYRQRYPEIPLYFVSLSMANVPKAAKLLAEDVHQRYETRLAAMRLENPLHSADHHHEDSAFLKSEDAGSLRMEEKPRIRGNK